MFWYLSFNTLSLCTWMGSGLKWFPLHLRVPLFGMKVGGCETSKNEDYNATVKDHYVVANNHTSNYQNVWYLFTWGSLDIIIIWWSLVTFVTIWIFTDIEFWVTKTIRPKKAIKLWPKTALGTWYASYMVSCKFMVILEQHTGKAHEGGGRRGYC